MKKQHYISEVSQPVRSSAIAAIVAAALVCAACFLIVVGIAIVAIDKAPFGPLMGCIGIFGLLTCVSGWISIRLLRKQRTANGRTVMPEWFIQIFGIVFLIGICMAAVINGQMWLLGEGVGIAIAMIGIRSLLRRPISIQAKANK